MFPDHNENKVLLLLLFLLFVYSHGYPWNLSCALGDMPDSDSLVLELKAYINMSSL